MRYQDWITNLTATSFLKEYEKYVDGKIYTLTTPIIVRFPKEVVEKVLAGYNPRFEIGGVFLAEPKLEDGNRVLEIKKIINLRNLSSTPEKRFFRPKIGSDIHKVWKNCLDRDKKWYIPIFFHSHPLVESDYARDINKLLAILTPVATSQADQRFALGLQIPMDNAKFLVPNALVVSSTITGRQTIVGFYGGGITPLDFKEYFEKLTGKTLKEIWDALHAWIEEDPNRIWLLILLGLLMTIPMVLYPKKVIPIVLVLAIIFLASQITPITRQAAEAIPNYFTLLRKEKALIKIP